MPATTSPAATSSSLAKAPLSVQRPTLSPRKRKFSDASAASPTSLDEVATAGSSSSTSLEERVISPKKKAKAEERVGGDLSKWESHVVASIASALDLDCMDLAEPIAFSAAAAGDLAGDELEILCRFLA